MANRQEIYEKFVAKFGAIPIDVLLPSMEMYGIIGDVERATVDGKPTRPDKLMSLFVVILPGKDDAIHDKLVQVFRQYQYTAFADYLENAFKKMTQTTSPIPTNPPNATASSTPPAEPNAPNLQQSHFRWELLELERRALQEAKPSSVDVPPQPAQTVATIDAANYYPFDPDQKQAFALIINNRDFRGHMPDRNGSERDVDEMRKLLTTLKYDVRVYENLTAQQIVNAAQEFAQLLKFSLSGMQGPKYYNSCVVVLMSHGEHGCLFGVDGQTVNERDIFQTMLSVEQLRERPKIFFVQACRGTDRDYGTHTSDSKAQEILNELVLTTEVKEIVLKAIEAHGKKTMEEMKQTFKEIPYEADMLVLYSTTPGYYSWRDTENGSWFVQSICEVFSQHAHEDTEDLLSLSTRVQNNVATKFKALTRFGGVLQMPEMTSRLRKRFRFRL